MLYDKSMPTRSRAILGAIFDVDDTLFDNSPGSPTGGLHERSRLAAVHEIGRRKNIPQLQQVTPQQNLDAFLTAKVHALDAAVWNVLRICGLVTAANIDPNHALLCEIIELKLQLHEKLLKSDGKEVPGAARFVGALATSGLNDTMAIASMAIRTEIMMFLEFTNLGRFFPESRIVSRELVAHPKPHPEAFTMAFASLGLPSSVRAHVLAFEDDPRGIASAKAAGLFTCAITTRFDRRQLAALETPPDLIADSYAEFEAVLGVNSGAARLPRPKPS